MCGGVGRQTVFDDDQLQVRMHAAQIAEQALGRVALTIVFRRPVRLEDRFGCQRKDLAVIRMHQHRPEHLMVVGRGAVAVMLLCTLRAVHLLRGEVAGAVEGQQVMPVEVLEPLQALAAL